MWWETRDSELQNLSKKWWIRDKIAWDSVIISPTLPFTYNLLGITNLEEEFISEELEREFGFPKRIIRSSERKIKEVTPKTLEETPKDKIRKTKWKIEEVGKDINKLDYERQKFTCPLLLSITSSSLHIFHYLIVCHYSLFLRSLDRQFWKYEEINIHFLAIY